MTPPATQLQLWSKDMENIWRRLVSSSKKLSMDSFEWRWWFKAFPFNTTFEYENFPSCSTPFPSASQVRRCVTTYPRDGSSEHLVRVLEAIKCWGLWNARIETTASWLWSLVPPILALCGSSHSLLTPALHGSAFSRHLSGAATCYQNTYF